jgi:hypothetical protein
MTEDKKPEEVHEEPAAGGGAPAAPAQKAEHKVPGSNVSISDPLNQLTALEVKELELEEKRAAPGLFARLWVCLKSKFSAEIKAKAEREKTRADISRTLSELENLTGQAVTPRVLNLQIILRRTYDGSMQAAEATTSTANDVATSARWALRLAMLIAGFGWLASVGCVVVGVVNSRVPGIREIWPALAATSGAVLLLIGIATLAFRFAQRSHDRARCHHDDAIRTRRLDTAIRLLMMIEARADSGTDDKSKTDAGLRKFAMKLVESSATKAGADEISAVPEGVTKIGEKVIDNAAEVSKQILGLTKKND